jgi:hypothetical protein
MTPGVVEPLVKMSRDENSRWTRSTTLRASPSFWTGTKHLAGQALSDDAIGKPTWPAYHRPDKPCLACKLTRGKLFQRVVVPWDCQPRPSPKHTGTTSVYLGSYSASYLFRTSAGHMSRASESALSSDLPRLHLQARSLFWARGVSSCTRLVFHALRLGPPVQIHVLMFGAVTCYFESWPLRTLSRHVTWQVFILA